MTIRHFNHTFSPSGQGTDGTSPLELTTTEIADAAIQEIVQISLSASPFDLLLEQLLDNSDQYFRWISRLGQIRETRTALSGLFGRFVARAYLTRYFGFAYFEPIRSAPQTIARTPALSLQRTPANGRGDLPDWVTATSAISPDIAIAEAKGSHNTNGSGPSLASAIEQAKRVGIFSGTTQLAIKRYAIATRWAVRGNPDLDQPWLSVDDPDDGERPPLKNEVNALRRSIALGHFAGLAEGFRLPNVASALLEAKGRSSGELHIDARDLVEIETKRGLSKVIAATVTRAGVIPLPDEITPSFQNDLKKVFGNEALLMAIDLHDLQNADQSQPSDGRMTELPTSIGSETDFWRTSRRQLDGSELLPLDAVEIRRRADSTEPPLQTSE